MSNVSDQEGYQPFFEKLLDLHMEFVSRQTSPRIRIGPEESKTSRSWDHTLATDTNRLLTRGSTKMTTQHHTGSPCKRRTDGILRLLVIG